MTSSTLQPCLRHEAVCALVACRIWCWAQGLLSAVKAVAHYVSDWRASFLTTRETQYWPDDGQQLACTRMTYSLRSTETCNCLCTGMTRAGQPDFAEGDGHNYKNKAKHQWQSEFPQLQSKVYVDHAGATLYSRSQITAVQQVAAQIPQVCQPARNTTRSPQY